MSTTTTPRQATQGAGAGWSTTDRVGSVVRPPGRRRNPVHLALGALLVVVCALGFAVTAGKMDHRSSVLALARPVTIGQILTGADLHAVPVSAGAGVDSVPAADSGSVIGRSVAVSLPAGALLTRAELGKASVAKFSTVNLVISKGPPVVPPQSQARAKRSRRWR